jgi:hypothetical protein
MLVGTLVTAPSCSGELPDGADSEDSAVRASAVAPELLVLDGSVADGAAAVTSQSDSAIYDPDCLISESGVAGIAIPLVLGDFVDAFPAGTTLSFSPAYMVDFGALCVRADDADALCAIFESYEVEAYSPDIESFALAVYTPVCRTASGIGPASRVDDVAAEYGPATFGFNYENEGREYVSFENAPSAFSFRAESVIGEAEEEARVRPAGRYGGNYAGVEGDGYFETNRAHSDARLWEIWISGPTQ